MDMSTTTTRITTAGTPSAARAKSRRPQPPRYVRGQGTAFYDKRGMCCIDHRIDGKVWRERATSWPEAEEMRDERRAGIRRRKAHGSELTLRQCFREWMENDVPHDARPGTIRNYLESLRVLENELGGDALIRELDVEALEDAWRRLAKRKTRPMGRTTLGKVRSHFGMALARPVRLGKLPRNIARDSELPRAAPATHTRPRRALEREAFSAVRERLAWSGANTYERALLTGLLSGLRPGEVLGLRWENVDFDARRLTVGSTLAYVNPDGRHLEVVEDTKNEGARRTLELPAELVAALRAERAEQVERRLAATEYADDSLVFASNTGRPLSHANLRRALRRVCAELDVLEVTPNELRHSFLSFLVDAGMSLPAAAAVAGHKNTRMMAARYAHALDAVIPTAALFDEAVGSVS